MFAITTDKMQATMCALEGNFKLWQEHFAVEGMDMCIEEWSRLELPPRVKRYVDEFVAIGGNDFITFLKLKPTQEEADALLDHVTFAMADRDGPANKAARLFKSYEYFEVQECTQLLS